jgi:hypothetical protein
MEGYDWLFKEVVICEVMFAILFAFFFYREVSQLVFDRIIPGIKSWKEPAAASVQPTDKKFDKLRHNEHEVDFDDEGVHKPSIFNDSNVVKKYDGKTNDADTVEMFQTTEVTDVKGLEQGLDMVDLNDNGREDSTPPVSTPPPQKKNKKKRMSWNRAMSGAETDDDLVEKVKKVEARNARSQRNLVTRMKSIGLDVNNNGIDDMDEIKEIIEDYLLPDAKGLADILDWVTIITIIVAIVYRVIYVNLALEIHDLFLHLDDGENFNHFMEDIVDDFEELDHIVDNIRIISLFIVIIGLFQFFRYLSFDRRFAIVTDTIMSSTVDLIPVLAIFAVVCISYAVMGTAIYGQDLVEFMDIGSSLSSLFLMILGQFEGYYDSKW